MTSTTVFWSQYQQKYPNPYEWEMSYSFSSSSPSPSAAAANAAIEGDQEEPEGDHRREGLVAAKKEEEALCEWDFSLSTVVSSATTTTPRAASDALGAVELDPTCSLLTTGGIARKIRVYKVSSMMNTPDDVHIAPTKFLDHSQVCEFYMCTPAKLSSLRWRPDCNGRVLGAGDYDGVVTEYDIERRTAVLERDEHGGRRVWSIAYSKCLPALGASASDDGNAHVWDTRAGTGPVSGIRPGNGSAVCSVEFDPENGLAMGVGCADRKAYIYDIRSMSAGPMTVFEGHTRAVTYVRFAGNGRAVSSGADGSHRLWQVENGKEEKVYTGHVNARSFIGMSVWNGGGLIGCGSENDQVFVYDLRWGEPIWVKRFSAADEDMEEEDEHKCFVGSVCWREEGSVGDDQDGLLIAGGSNGVVQIFVARRKPLLRHGN